MRRYSDAVSVRNIAAELSARPMSLYRYVADKDELIAAMVDSVISEMILDSPPTEWRSALHAIATRTLEVGARHRWLTAVAFQAPQTGTNAIAHAEQSMRAVAQLRAPEEALRTLLMSVDVFTIGFAMSQPAIGEVGDLDERAALLHRGLDWIMDGFESSLS
jgi:AcrR family transcriptional regulator